MSDDVRCIRCEQLGVLIEANHQVFGRAMYFGSKDDWAFIPQAGGLYLCGSCALDEKNDFELAEYGIKKVNLGKFERGYRKIEKPVAAVPISYQDIPPEFRSASLAKCPLLTENKIKNWYESDNTLLCILGDGLVAAWAIFRRAQLDGVGAQFWRMDELVSRIRNEENQGMTYSGTSPTSKLIKHANGIVIIHDLLGVNLTASRSEWIGAILDDRYSYRRKTVVTIGPMDTGIPNSIQSRLTRGTVVPVCEWAHAMLKVEYVPRVRVNATF